MTYKIHKGFDKCLTTGKPRPPWTVWTTNKDGQDIIGNFWTEEEALKSIEELEK